MSADLTVIAEQERRLIFPRFDLDAAWRLGSRLREAALAQAAPVAIDISLHERPLFHAALPGADIANADWVRRKRNTVLRLGASTLGIGMKLAASGETLDSRYGLSSRDHAAHGGGFPLKVEGLGCIGAITVSGLAQAEDHGLIVSVLEAWLEA